MANRGNHTGKLYIRSKTGYRKPPKRLVNLPDGENYQLFWYEGIRRKSKNVGKFADAAQVARNNKEAELRNAAITVTTLPATVAKVESATPTSRDFNTAVMTYLTEVKNAKTQNTYVTYETALRQFASGCKATTLEAITRQHVLDFINAQSSWGNSKTTIANRLQYLYTFFRHFGLAWPLLVTDRVKATKKGVKTYSEEDLNALFAAADEEETDLFQFYLCTGFRKQEVMYVTWSDVDFHAKKIGISEKLNMGFSPKDKEEGNGVPVPDYLIARLRARRDRYPNSRLIFPLPEGKPDGHMLRTLQELAFKAGLNCGCCYTRNGKCCKDATICHRWGLHKFRRTFATMHHEGGESARTIQRWLRHSSLEITLRYLAGADDKSEKTRSRVNNTFAGLQAPAEPFAV